MYETVYRELVSSIQTETMRVHLAYFSTLHRLTGKPDSEAAANYIADRLLEYGVSYELHEFDGYFSDPIKSELVISGTVTEPIYSKPRSFSAACPEGVSGRLFYDRYSQGQQLAPNEEREWYAQCQGKIVLSWNFYEDYVKKIESYGALGLIHIWPTGEDVIHEETVGPVWGTPTLANAGWIPSIPVIGIRKTDGAKLIESGAALAATVRIRSWVDNHVAKAYLPVAYIPGKTPDYILVSGHYDSWYEGVTDNAVGNAVCLEMARVLAAFAGKMERGIMLAWWPGHSNGRYMGSAWFCDHFWHDLNEYCMGHLNIDSPGSKGGAVVLPRTTRLEGTRFTADLIEDFTGKTPDTVLDIPRGADQSFWGVDIPLHLMYKYQPVPEQNIYSCPGSGGGWWWHSEYDSMDKVDESLLLRDAGLNLATAIQLADAKRLPADFPAYFARLRELLEDLSTRSDPAFDFAPLLTAVENLAQRVLRVMADITEDAQANRVIKVVGSRLNRLLYSSGSRYDFDNTFPAKPFPGLHKVVHIHQSNSPAEQFLFARTDFIRQRNRITNEIRLVERELGAVLAGIW